MKDNKYIIMLKYCGKIYFIQDVTIENNGVMATLSNSIQDIKIFNDESINDMVKLVKMDFKKTQGYEVQKLNIGKLER